MARLNSVLNDTSTGEQNRASSKPIYMRIRNIQYLSKWHLRVMLKICSPICFKTLLATFHLNPQQPTWNIPSFADKQYNFVLSDIIPCGYLNIANSFLFRLFGPDPGWCSSGAPPVEWRPSHFKISPGTRAKYRPRQICAWAWSWGRATQSCCCHSWGKDSRCYRLSRCGLDSQPQSQHRQYCRL